MNHCKTMGLVAAPPTGFKTDGGIDVEAVQPLAEHLGRQGVAGVFVNGTTGEGMSLSGTEREQLASEWRRVLPAGMKLFVHAGHNCQGEAIRMARHAQSIGADAVAAIAPGFFKPAGIDDVLEWCAPVAAAAPALPFYFYHMPSMSGVNLSITRLLERAGNRIPNLAGVKFTFEAMSDYLSALRVDGGRFDVLWGRDEMLLGALAMGAEGGVGSTYNIMAPLFLNLMETYRAGDMAAARTLQARAVDVITVLVESGTFFSALKAVLQAQGVPLALSTRSPLRPLTAEQAAAVCRRVQAILADAT